MPNVAGARFEAETPVDLADFQTTLAVEIIVTEVEKIIHDSFGSFQEIYIRKSHFKLGTSSLKTSGTLIIYLVNYEDEELLKNFESDLNSSTTPIVVIGIKPEQPTRYRSRPLLSKTWSTNKYEMYFLSGELWTKENIPNKYKQHTYLLLPTDSIVPNLIEFTGFVHPSCVLEFRENESEEKSSLLAKSKFKNILKELMIKQYIRNHGLFFPLWTKISESNKQKIRKMISLP